MSLGEQSGTLADQESLGDPHPLLDSQSRDVGDTSTSAPSASDPSSISELQPNHRTPSRPFQTSSQDLSSTSAANLSSFAVSPLSVHATAYSPKDPSGLSKTNQQNGSTKLNQVYGNRSFSGTSGSGASPAADGSVRDLNITSGHGSRQSSGGAALPSLSVSSADARSPNSPAPRSPFSSSYSPRAFGQSETPSSGDRLLTSPQADSFRRSSHSSTLAPHSNLTDARPPFSRQSLSDGLNSATDMSMGAHAQTYNSQSSQQMFTHALSSQIGQDPSGAASPTPNTGPFSASDPRTQLLVSNLPYRVRWQDLKDLFRKAGTVLRTDVSLSADNRSRGYGTVLMANEQDAIKAVEMLGGFTWQSRTLDVRIDRSGSMGGVAGSAIIPSLNTSTTLPSSGPTPIPVHGQSAYANNNIASTALLNLPALGGSQGHSSSPLGASSPLLGVSPSTTSPLAQAVHATPFAARNSIAGLYEGAISPRLPLNATTRDSAGIHAQMLAVEGSPHATPGQPTAGTRTASGSAIQPFLSVQGAPRRASDIGTLPTPSQLSSWSTSGGQDSSALPQHQGTGGSSVPTGFPGATTMAPWPPGPGSFSNAGPPSLQSQPFTVQSANIPTTSYAGRVLFVGNLPFHCQWQDLKDLFRAAGTIQRADVAIGPDGRSRGFGTVLFSSQEDAQNAVRLYHGYEYSGRTLKVHFDRFATQQGPAVGTPGNPAQYTSAFAAAALPSHMTNNVRPPAFAPINSGSQNVQMPAHTLPQAPHFQHQQQQFQSNPQFLQHGQGPFMQSGQQHSQPSFQQQQQQQSRYVQQRTQQQPSFALPGAQSSLPQSQTSDLSQRSKTSQDPRAYNHYAAYPRSFGLFESADSKNVDSSYATNLRNAPMSIGLPSNGDFGDAVNYLPSDLMSPGLVSPEPPRTQETSRPGRIHLPGFANNSSSVTNSDPTSPMAGRMSGLMTPGMPGFTFQQMPQTPPLHPHFLSPGLGAFSPGDGSFASGSANDFPGFTNVAPGAPFQMSAMISGNSMGFNPAFSGSRGQQQPATPHWSQPSGPSRGSANRSSGDSQDDDVTGTKFSNVASHIARADIAKTPGSGPRSRPPPLNSSAVGEGDAAPGSKVMVRRASDSTPGPLTSSMDEGYPFPLVAPSILSQLSRRASTNSPASSIPHAQESATADRAGPPLISDEALASTSAEELAKTIARLSVRGTAMSKDADAKRSNLNRQTSGSSSLPQLKEHLENGTTTQMSPNEKLSGALGAPFGSDDAPSSGTPTKTGLRLGLQGLTNADPSSSPANGST